MSLLNLHEDLWQSLGSFLDYESFCNTRLTCRELRKQLVFAFLQDWTAAIDKNLVERLVQARSPREEVGGTHSSPNNHVETWMNNKHAVFRVNVNNMGTKLLVCSKFVPNMFQKTRCRNCQRMEEVHFEKRKGGKLCINPGWEIRNLQHNNITTAPMPFRSTTKELYFNLRTTLRFAQHISSDIKAMCRSQWDETGRIDSVDCYLYGPLRIRGGKYVESLNVEIVVNGDNFGTSFPHGVKGCSLEVLSAEAKEDAAVHNPNDEWWFE